MTTGPGAASRRADAAADPFAYDDGAYVLGALSPDERAAFERHLGTCAACRARVAEIEALPAQLADVEPALVDDRFDADAAGIPSDVELPETLLPGLLRRASAERRRRHRLVGALAAVAAACVLALAVVLWPSPTASVGHPASRALSQVVASPVQADATLVAKAWGTEIDVHCRYSAHVDQGLPYVLVVRDRHGRKEELGTWTLPPGEGITFTAGTALRPSQIDRVEVALPDGTAILRLRN